MMVRNSPGPTWVALQELGDESEDNLPEERLANQLKSSKPISSKQGSSSRFQPSVVKRQRSLTSTQRNRKTKGDKRGTDLLPKPKPEIIEILDSSQDEFNRPPVKKKKLLRINSPAKTINLISSDEENPVVMPLALSKLPRTPSKPTSLPTNEVILIVDDDDDARVQVASSSKVVPVLRYKTGNGPDSKSKPTPPKVSNPPSILPYLTGNSPRATGSSGSHFQRSPKKTFDSPILKKLLDSPLRLQKVPSSKDIGQQLEKNAPRILQSTSGAVEIRGDYVASSSSGISNSPVDMALQHSNQLGNFEHIPDQESMDIDDTTNVRIDIRPYTQVQPFHDDPVKQHSVTPRRLSLLNINISPQQTQSITVEVVEVVHRVPTNRHTTNAPGLSPSTDMRTLEVAPGLHNKESSGTSDLTRKRSSENKGQSLVEAIMQASQNNARNDKPALSKSADQPLTPLVVGGARRTHARPVTPTSSPNSSPSHYHERASNQTTPGTIDTPTMDLSGLSLNTPKTPDTPDSAPPLPADGDKTDKEDEDECQQILEYEDVGQQPDPVDVEVPSCDKTSARRTSTPYRLLSQTTDVGKTYGGFKVHSWASYKRDLSNVHLECYLSRDLPHSLQDHINQMSLETRLLPQMRFIFAAAMLENTVEDEPDAPPINIINDVDCYPNPPWEFHYSNRMWHGNGVPLPDVTKLESCDCVGRCDPKSETCACAIKQRRYTSDFSNDFAYDMRGRLRIPVLPIFECNALCGCDDDCRNRVVQHGRKVQVNIAKTPQKGWGIFNGPKKLYQGTFIGIYSGELITDAEGEERGYKYNKFGRTYLFDIDFHHLKVGKTNWDTKYVVDAYHSGNFTRFLNHSCNPNCRFYPCYINEADIEKPLLAVFSTRDIEPEEEICFSYSGVSPTDEDYSDDENVNSMNNEAVYVKCLCGATNCTGIMFK